MNAEWGPKLTLDDLDHGRPGPLAASSVGAGWSAGAPVRMGDGLGLTAAAMMAAAAVLTPLVLDGSPVGLLGFGGFLLWLVFIASTSLRLLRGDVSRTATAAIPELAHAS